MKAHFKRSMKEYNSEFLKDNDNCQGKQRPGFQPLTGHKNMPKPNHSADTDGNLASSVASASLINQKNDIKNKGFPKRPQKSIYSLKKAISKTYHQLNSNDGTDQTSHQGCDIDMEDNNNELVIDEGESTIEIDLAGCSQDTETQKHEKKPTLNKSNDDITSIDKDTIDNDKDEEDIIVDDIDGKQENELQFSTKDLVEDNITSPTSPTPEKVTNICGLHLNTFRHRRELQDDVGFMTDEVAEETIDDGSKTENVYQGTYKDDQNIDRLILENERRRKCNWCQKPGPCSIVMQVSESMELDAKKPASKNLHNDSKRDKKAFCNERCFSLYRRAAFKKNRRCEWCRRPNKQPLSIKDEQHRQFCRLVYM